MAYVNIKTFDHTVAGGEVKGTEVSVDFKVYSNSHRIADARYQTFPSEKPAYSTVIDDAAAWATANAKMFEAVPADSGV
ncbi:virion structural protein [Klebsiella phage Kpn BM7]|jgi:hypothetical protein|nr:virion structural protein [Klebsiella phage Kpn BM7]